MVNFCVRNHVLNNIVVLNVVAILFLYLSFFSSILEIYNLLLLLLLLL